jgi:hypothetical protein
MNCFLYDDVRIVRWRLLRYPLLGCHLEQLVELLQRRFVGDKAPVNYKLRVLAESHGVGLGFGEVSP